MKQYTIIFRHKALNFLLTFFFIEKPIKLKQISSNFKYSLIIINLYIMSIFHYDFLKVDVVKIKSVGLFFCNLSFRLEQKVMMAYIW